MARFAYSSELTRTKCSSYRRDTPAQCHWNRPRTVFFLTQGSSAQRLTDAPWQLINWNCWLLFTRGGQRFRRSQYLCWEILSGIYQGAMGNLGKLMHPNHNELQNKKLLTRSCLQSWYNYQVMWPALILTLRTWIRGYFKYTNREMCLIILHDAFSCIHFSQCFSSLGSESDCGYSNTLCLPC